MKKVLSALALVLSVQVSFAQWNPDPSINLQISPSSVADLHAIRAQNGRTWIAFYRQTGSSYQMMAQLLDTAGNKLLGNDGVVVDSLPSGTATYVFNIALDQKGNLIIGMQDQRSGSTMTTVGYKIDQSGNSLWNGADGFVLGSGYSPYPVALKSGGIAFAWVATNNKINIQVVDSTGAGVWTNPISIIPASGNSTRAQLSPMSDSGFVAIYQVYNFGINSTLYAQRFSKDGIAEWTSPVQLSNEATQAVRYYSLKNEADTTYLGYWTSNTSNHFNSWLQRINPDGTLPYGINGAAFSDYSGGGDPQEMGSQINFDPGSPVIWAVASMSDPNQDQYGVYVQKFKKSNGTRLLDPFGKVVYPINASGIAQEGNLALKDGRPVFMVADDINYHIKATVLDDSGNLFMVPPDVDLSTTNASMATPKGRLTFTDNVDNFCVALWTEFRGSSDPLAYAQRFSLDMLDTSISVATENNVPAEIDSLQGTLQMVATIHPSAASQDVVWSVVNETGDATVSNSGLVTAVSAGTVWVKAVSVAAPSYSDSLEVTIHDQDTGGNAGITIIQNPVGLHLFPNPTSGIITLAAQHNHPQLDMEIFDFTGRNVFSEKIAANELLQPKTIDLKNLSTGVYLIQFKGTGVQFSQKVILDR